MTSTIFHGKLFQSIMDETMKHNLEFMVQQRNGFNVLIQDVIQLLQNPSQFCHSYSVVTDKTDDIEIYCKVLSFLSDLLQRCSTSVLNTTQQKEELERIGLSKSYIDLLTEKEIQTQIKHVVQGEFCTIFDLKWRLDVVVSSESLSKILKPIISLDFMLDDGRNLTCQLSLEEFQDLRFKVAKTLKDIESVETHPLMKALLK